MLYFNDNDIYLEKDMTLEQFEKKVRQHLQSNTTKLAELFDKHPSAVKNLGAGIWDVALLNNSRSKNDIIKIFIKHNVPVNMPRANARILNVTDNTLMLAIKHRSLRAVIYLINKHKTNQKILNTALIKVSGNSKHKINRIIAKALIEKGAEPSALSHRAILNATTEGDGGLIHLLVEKGSFLVNQQCATLYLDYIQSSPYEYLIINKDDRNIEAIMGCLVDSKVENDKAMAFLKANDR